MIPCTFVLLNSFENLKAMFCYSTCFKIISTVKLKYVGIKIVSVVSNPTLYINTLL